VHLLKSNNIIKLSFSFSFAIRFAFTNLSSLRAKNWSSPKIIIVRTNLIARVSRIPGHEIRIVLYALWDGGNCLLY